MVNYLAHMAIAPVESWLNGKRDYSNGVSLFCEYSTDDVLKNLFTSGKNSYTIKLLAEELSKLKQQKEPDLVAIEEKEWELTDEEYNRLSPEGKQLQADWKKWYAEMKYLQVKCDTVSASQEYIREMAERILELDDKIRDAWQQINYWRKFNELPKKQSYDKDLSMMTPAQLLTRRNTVRTYITKFEKDETKADKVKIWQNEIFEIEKLLNAGK